MGSLTLQQRALNKRYVHYICGNSILVQMQHASNLLRPALPPIAIMCKYMGSHYFQMSDLCAHPRERSHFKKGGKKHDQTNHVLAWNTARRLPNFLHSFSEFRSSREINITLQLLYSIYSLHMSTNGYIKTYGCLVLSVSFSLGDFSGFNCGLYIGHYYILIRIIPIIIRTLHIVVIFLPHWHPHTLGKRNQWTS